QTPPAGSAPTPELTRRLPPVHRALYGTPRRTESTPSPPSPRTPVQIPPVLVLGAGPVGQTTALLLARRGVPVQIVDARPAREAIGSKAICQQRDVLDVWDWIGAGRITTEGLTWDTARTFYRDHQLFGLHLAAPVPSP